ncbi:MAG: 2Fe-2S iron-sulfur cluster-binding protein, partial [Oligoflexia bacterium]|nr:2Fe-2S iron-sulfur cluster-binding protein [Oligoflexia bacterium]
MEFQLKVWKQKGPKEKGFFKNIPVKNISANMSFLEMLDFVNETLILKKEEPIAFDHDCREGICGTCGFMINGSAHGPNQAITTCQLYMREFKDGSDIWIEPFRAKAFPIIRDLIVDRSA